MKLEKLYNSPLFHFFEILYKLIIFNLLFILTLVLGLGIFGYMISLIILVLAIKSLDNEIEYSIVKTWIMNIKKHFKSSLKLSIFYTVSSSFFVFDTIYFYLSMEQAPTVFNTIFFYVFLVVDMFVGFAVINSAFVYVYFPNLNIRKNLKYSFKLIQLIPMQALLLIFGFGITVVLFYVFPIALAFIWFSLVIFVYHLSIKKTYKRLVADDVKSLNMFEY